MKFIALSAISSLMSLTSAAFVEPTDTRPYRHEITLGLITGEVLEGKTCIDGSNCLLGLACGNGILTGETAAKKVCMNIIGCIADKDTDLKMNIVGESYGKKSEKGCASWPVGA